MTNSFNSGGIKPVLNSAGGNHSIFAKALIDVLNSHTGVLEGTQIYKEVKDKMLNATASLGIDQVPSYAALKDSEHKFSDFLLITRSD